MHQPPTQATYADDAGLSHARIKLMDGAPIAPHAGPNGRAAGIMFLTNDSRTLLLMRGNGGDFPRTFGFPGGHLEEGETLEDAARREALEETGFDYQGPLTLLSDNGQFATFLATGVDAFEVKICDESMGFTWTPLDAAPQPLHPGIPDAFRIASASNERDVCELIRDGLLQSPFDFGNCTYFKLRITGTGMAYRSALEQHVFRDPALFANERFAERCNGLFVVWQHPDTKNKLLDSETFGSSNVGAIVLPWVDYDRQEVWGIARVMDDTARAQMKSVQLSTSPGVSHTNASEGDKVTLDGEELLIEGSPVLLDHLAVCELGVWDKGGPPVGVQIDQPKEVEMPGETTAIADSQPGAANGAASLDLSAITAAFGTMLQTALAPVHAKMDAMEKNMPAPPLKAAADSAAELEAKAKADAEEKEKEEKAKADAEEKAKADAEEKAKMDSIKADEDSGMFADAQAKCDSVAQLYNQQAGRQLVGETLLDFRRRLVKPFQQHSSQWKTANLSAITDSAVFDIAEKAIYADAATAAHSVAGAGGRLREIRRRGPHGREIIEFAGPIGEWSAPFRMAPKTLVRINKEVA